ncbi:MAG: alanine racemase [Sphingomonadaceae bacterium]|nr:alanine racemase [Sphingomonadaceae bacterium]
MTAPLRLRLDRGGLSANWRWLQAQSGHAACGAAVKANGYGLGAPEVVQHLLAAGCRDFFVATWAEAAEIEPILPQDASLSVLHGVREEDIAQAMASRARPVLNTAQQVARWRPTGKPCDVMLDTGMNRLGLAPGEDLSGLKIHTLMSHLASADEDVPKNMQQLDLFQSAAATVPAQRLSLANSAGICLGAAYHFGLTRPGLALYGGIPRGEAVGAIQPVVGLEAQVLQRRVLPIGQSIGYNATYTADRALEVAIVNIGYADGYVRGFSGRGTAGGGRLPLLGRVSMDLVALDVSATPDIAEGDWLSIDFHLPDAARQSGLSQYELLTLLGHRFDRIWA